MNSKRFDGKEYAVRPIADLKDIVFYSTDHYPERTAYLEKDRPGGTFQPITYGQVRSDLEALGTRLVDMGLNGEKIAVIGETSYRWILTYFTVVCGVGVIVPLDKNLPAEEMHGLVKRSGAKAIVYAKKMEKNIEGLFVEPHDLQYFISMDQADHDEKVLSLPRLIQEGTALLEDGHRSYVEATVDPDQLSTLLFTSGTTGMAKGVMLSHRNIANNVMQMSKFFRIPDGGIVYSILPIHHVYEMTCDIWTTFYQGQTIAICEGLKHLMQNMTEVHPNVMLGVPLVFEKMYKGMLKQAVKTGQYDKLRQGLDLSKRLKLYRNPAVVRRMFKTIHNSFGGSIEKFVVGGAAADPVIMEEFEAMGFAMIQGYGMTECAPILAVNQDRYRKSASAGKPLPGAEIHILDPDEDGIGEVIVRSDSVMMGYYENEEATAETLIDGWLHTGDLGYFDQDGFLYLTGRKKTVIVTKGGKNIFPEEIEEVLMGNELIQEVLVHGISDKNVGNTVIAADIYPNYAQLKEEKGDMTASEIYYFYRDLVEAVNKELPPYKVIKRVKIRETEFAKTTTGKIKRYGNFIEGDETRGEPEQQEIRQEEKRHAKQIMDEIATDPSPLVAFRDGMPICDVRDLLSRAAEKYGDHTAFLQRFGGEEAPSQISYRQVQADVTGLGTALINEGLKKDSIAIIGDMSYQWCTAYLAVMGGVGTALPLDKNMDPASIEQLLYTGKITCVFFDEKHREVITRLAAKEGSGVKRLVDMSQPGQKDGKIIGWRELINQGLKQMSQGDRQFIDSDKVGGQVAAIHITTGTDGKLKGVRLSNTNVTENLMAMASMIALKPGEVAASALPEHHSMECICGALLPLYKGATVAFCRKESLEEDLARLKPSLLMATPEVVIRAYRTLGRFQSTQAKRQEAGLLAATQRLLSRAVSGRNKELKGHGAKLFGPELRTMLTLGGQVDDAVASFLQQAGIEVLSSYGQTECGALAAVMPADPRARVKGSAGRILPTMGCRIVDKGVDGIGEICLSGENVMLGYVDDIEGTEATLKDGWLYTGDMGSLTSDRTLFVKGRKSNILTAEDGTRIYPEEVEASLRTIDLIEDAYLWMAEEGPNAGVLTATVVVSQEDEPVRAAIEEALLERNMTVPAALKIRRILYRQAPFCKTPGGKIRRRELSNREER